MALLRRFAPAALAATLAACGLSGADGGGYEHLPSASGGPYAKLASDSTTPAEEPYVIVDSAASLRDPAARAAPGGGFDLWFTRAPSAGAAVEIWYAHLPSLTGKPDVGPVLVLAPAEAWEGDAVSAPSLVDAGDGTLLLYYQGGDDAAPAIGRARSLDGGRSFTREGMVLAGAAHPSALRVGAHTYLYFGAPDGTIGVAEADGEGDFVRAPAPVLVPRAGEPEAFDQARVAEPDAVGGLTPAGQLHVTLFYVGTAQNGTAAIGASASEDGHTFMPYLGGAAVLEPGAPDDHAPAAVLEPDRGVLFFSQERAARTVIAVATTSD